MITIRQTGFSAVEAMVIILLAALLAVSGWFVWHRQHTTTTKNSATTAKKDAVIPEGYTTYNSTDYGFSYAYPDEWGKFMEPTSAGYNLATYPVGNLPFGEQSILSDAHGFTATKISDFRGGTGKYGASLQPVKQADGYIWKVVEVNPADSVDKIGDIYSVKSFQSASGVTIYDFTSRDEGTVHGNIAFVSGNNFISIGLPGMWTPIPNDPGGYKEPPANDVTAYHDLIKTVADTVTVR